MGNEKITITWNGHALWPTFHRYQNNNRIAIRLMDEDGPYCHATTNVVGAKLANDEVVIKDYSENKGLLPALVAAGLVEDTGRRVDTGYVTVPVCRLLVAPAC